LGGQRRGEGFAEGVAGGPKPWMNQMSALAAAVSLSRRKAPFFMAIFMLSSLSVVLLSL
jgi:hypothetical protein